MKRWLLMLGLVVLIVVLVATLKGFKVKAQFDEWAAMGEPLATVSTVKVGYQQWQPKLDVVGTTRAVRGVDLAAEMAGVVQDVHFRSGMSAKKDDLLVQLSVDTDLARLKALEADAALANVVAERSRKQLEAQATSQAQVDTDLARLKSAEAAVAEQQAVIQRKAIRAPFNGQLGISAVNPGQYLNPGEKVVTLQQLDPIHVDFTVPQGSLSQITPGMEVSATTDSFPGLKFKGDIDAINPVVDTDTRNVRVQATLRNPDLKLLPGMFVNLTVASGAEQRYLTLPSNAVAFNPYGETVFVIAPQGDESLPDPNKPAELVQTEALKQEDGKLKDAADAKAGVKPPPQMSFPAPADGKPRLVARQLFIGVGPSRGDQVAVLSGLKEGDEVVTSGQIKLKNGTLVVVNNMVQPSNDADPRPVDK